MGVRGAVMENIKFRAYSKERNKMYEVACINYVSKQVGSIMRKYKTQQRTLYTHDWMKDIDLMRYIGLKDNYGTEIYEYDIVEHFDGEYYFTGVVTYSPFGWYVKSKYDNISFEHFADESSETANCKVIGNIYEAENKILKELGENDDNLLF